MQRTWTRRVMLAALCAGAVLGWTTRFAGAQTADELSEEVRQYVSVDDSVVAITGVRLIDGTGAEPRDDVTILLRGETIAAVGPTASVDVPEHATVLERDGYTVIPGIVGLHNHLFYAAAAGRVLLPYSAPRIYLGSGVTTIRTAGSYAPYQQLNLKRDIRIGERPGPRIVPTGPYLTGSGANSYQYDVAGPDDARRVVSYWAQEGVSWFKVYTSIQRDELKAIVDEAHDQDIKVMGHLCSVSFEAAVARNIDNLEHGLFTNSGVVDDRQPNECPSGMRRQVVKADVQGSRVQETIRTMVENDVALTSTLAVLEALVPGRPPLQQRVLDAMTPRTRAAHKEMRQEVQEREEESIMGSLFQKELAFEKAFVEAGGLMGAGADPTGNGGALPGFADQRNYELLLEAGFSPVQAIQIMTGNGAKIVDAYDDYGTVEPGKSADLVLIDGDPIDRPREIRNVETVFKRGIGYDSSELIADVEGMVGAK